MLQIANVVILLILICAVAYLLYDRRRVNALLEEKDRGEWVTQTELDSYHHRVVQLYQTQRDWLRGKFEEADHRLRGLDKAVKEAPPQGTATTATVLVTTAVDEARVENPPIVENLSSAPDFLIPAQLPTLSALEPVTETATETETFATAEEKVLKAWAAGRSIDQIAQELRMGRQEVQLLIQVSRRRPAPPVGA